MPLLSPYDDKVTQKPKRLASPYDDTARTRPKLLLSPFDEEPIDTSESYPIIIGKSFAKEALTAAPKAAVAADVVKERAIEDVKKTLRPMLPRPGGGFGTPEERARAIAEITGKPYVPPIPQKVTERKGKVRPFLEEKIAGVEKALTPDVGKSRFKQIVSQAAGSLGRMVGTGFNLKVLAAGEAFRKTEEALEGGADLPTAGVAGTISGLTEYFTEKIPYAVLKRPGLSFLKRLKAGIKADAPGEVIATLVEMGVVDENILNKNYTWADYKRAVVDTLAVSALVTGGATAVVSPFVSPRVVRPDQALPAVEKEIVARPKEGVIKGLTKEERAALPTEEELRVQEGLAVKPQETIKLEKQITKLNAKISDWDITISEVGGQAQYRKGRAVDILKGLEKKRDTLLSQLQKKELLVKKPTAETSVVAPAVISQPEVELAREIDNKTPKADLTGGKLAPVDLPDSFENDRAPMDLTNIGKRERAKVEVLDKPKVKAEADRTYKQLVRDGLITELTDKDIGKIEKEVMFPHTIAKKFPKFKPIYEISLDMEAQTDSRISNYAKILDPYLNLKNKKKLDALMIEEDVARGGRMYSAQERSARLTPEENAAWAAFRATTREAKFDLGDMLIELGNDPNKVTAFINKLPDTYVPLSRFGNYQVYVEDRAGDEVSYTFHKKKRAAQAEARKWAGKGKVTIGKIKQTSDELLNDIPINILAGLKAFDKELNTDFTKAYGGIFGRGFPTHLLERKAISGFETDLTKPISNYLLSIGKYIERKRAKVKFANELTQIDPKTESNLFTASSKYIKYMTGHVNELSKFRQWMFRYYLGGNLKSALLNATQTFTTTVPSFSKYTGNSAIKVAKASNVARQPLETIRKKDANLANALEQAIYDGIISEQFVTMLRGGAYQGLNLNTTDKALSFFFNHVEVFNRKVAFIAAFKSATNEGVRIKDFDGKKRKVKLSHKDAIKFAEDFVNETQFNYTKADRPAITRGLKAPFFTFRMFTGNYLSMLKNFISDREFGALARTLGVAVALGGIKAFPGARDLIKALEAMGYDPEKELRDATGKYGDLLLHGALFPTGVDISGAVNTLEIVPRDAQQGAWPAVASIVLGVPTDLPKRIDKAIFFAHDLKDPWRAVEAIMPEAVRNPMVAVRWAREGAARTAFGEPIAKPGIGSILLKAVSIQPSILTKAYEREHSEKLLSERARNSSKNVSFMIARAIFNKDEEGLKQLFLDISKHNESVEKPSELIIVNERSVKEALANMIYPEAVELRRMPKKARSEFLEIQETFREQE